MIVNAGIAAVSGTSTAVWIFYLWLIGCLSGAALLFAGSFRLWWQARRATTLLSEQWIRTAAELTAAFDLVRPVRLLVSRDSLMPLTWGYMQPRILLPEGAETWSPSRIRVVLAHEFAHVKRNDWPLQLLAEIGRTLYWFNPLVWICCNRLRQESEQACDDAVLLSGVKADDYAGHLLELARTLKTSEQPWAASLAMARRSHLERRFAAMLNPVLKRNGLTNAASALTTLAAIALLVPLACVRAPAQTSGGRLSGTVYDPSGGAVPNATLIASNAQSRTKDMTVSDATGAFEFQSLQPGEYSLEVLKPGFAKAVLGVKLEPGQALVQNATLQVGMVNEQVEVVAQGFKAAPAPSSGEPKRLRIGGNVQATKILNMVRPTYPPAAKAAGITGSVLLSAVIGVEGELLALRVLNSHIDPDLAKAAVEAVSKWRYQPTLLNGVPVEVLTNITVNFTLTE
jgi:TonB family protein